MKHDYPSPANQRIVAQLVDREVLLCMSYMVSRLAELEPDNEDIVTLLTGRPDYEEAVLQNEDSIDWCDVADELRVLYTLPKDEDGDNDYKAGDVNARAAVYAAIEKGDVDWEQVCGEAGIDPDEYLREPYEFWAVTGWAADELRRRGECVVETSDIEIWGRPATGQAISMDHVWWEIADEMEILVGQRNDWSKR